jgi:hypothetical protein
LNIKISKYCFNSPLLCFQSQYLIHFEISNKITGEDIFEVGGGLIFYLSEGAWVMKI